MHCGLEARSPLLDHELAEFCASLPLRMKVRHGTGKYLLKQLAAKTFGKRIRQQNQAGLRHPAHEWLGGALNAQMTDVLSDRGLMEPFDPGEMRASPANSAPAARTTPPGYGRSSCTAYGETSAGHAPHFDTAPRRHADVGVESVAP